MLTGPKIVAEVAAGAIRISPFDARMVNPNSLDLTLGDTLLLYHLRPGECLDVAKDNPTYSVTIPPDGIVLRPGQLYLGTTAERVATDRYVGVVEGKSSLGRLGLCAHVTAGFIDTGFAGQITLEMIVAHPVRIRAGMRICQICFSTVEGEIQLYAGKYQHQVGVQASRSWQDFEE